MEEKLNDELEKAKCIIKLLELDIEDLRNTLERKVEEVYPEFMKDYKIMRDELNDCYDELTEERKQSEIVLKELESKVAEYERKFEEGEVVSAEYHEEQMAILNCERNQLEKDVRDLQAEIDRLKETYTCNTYKDSWKNKFFKAQEEIEYLKTCGDQFLADYKKAQEEVENMQDVIFALEEDKRILQKQVDELTKEANQDTVTHIDLCTENLSLRKQNTELRKQVDELTAFKEEAISMNLYGKGRKDGAKLYSNRRKSLQRRLSKNPRR